MTLSNSSPGRSISRNLEVIVPVRDIELGKDVAVDRVTVQVDWYLSVEECADVGCLGETGLWKAKVGNWSLELK